MDRESREMSSDSDSQIFMPNEAHVIEPRSEQLLAETAELLAQVMWARQLANLTASMSAVISDLRIAASAPSTQKLMLSRLRLVADQLQRDVNYIARIAHASTALSSLSTQALDELSIESDMPEEPQRRGWPY